MNVKPAISFFTKDGQAPFTDKVTTILSQMKNNASYASLAPAVQAVQTAFDAFKTASANAAQGGRQNIAIRNSRRADLVALLRPLASNVSAIANGNMEVLLSSGFPVQKQGRTPIGPLPAPDAPILKQGPVTGSMLALTSRVKGASTYNWSVALETAPDVDVQSAQTTGTRMTFTGLPIGQVYLVSVNAVGAAGTSDWSDYGSLMVI